MKTSIKDFLTKRMMLLMTLSNTACPIQKANGRRSQAWCCSWRRNDASFGILCDAWRTAMQGQLKYPRETENFLSICFSCPCCNVNSYSASTTLKKIWIFFIFFHWISLRLILMRNPFWRDNNLTQTFCVAHIRASSAIFRVSCQLYFCIGDLCPQSRWILIQCCAFEHFLTMTRK